MIIRLRGQVVLRGNGYAILDVSGVGYQVFMSSGALADLKEGREAGLWTYEHVREDIHDLYGFLNQRERELFLELLGVSGVGPKVALNILSLGKPEQIGERIDAGDADWIARVPGIGKKTAQKIILELKGKLVQVGEGDAVSGEVVSALVNLGYSREQASEAASQAGDGAVEERLKAALKAMAR